jgi:hypothetical protein
MLNSPDERESPEERDNWGGDWPQAPRGALWQNFQWPTGPPIFGWQAVSTLIVLMIRATGHPLRDNAHCVKEQIMRHISWGNVPHTKHSTFNDTMLRADAS